MLRIYTARNLENGYVKIGVTENIERRRKQLENGCGNEVFMEGWMEIHNASEIEKFLHSTFAHLRKKGEWFELGEKEDKFICDFWKFYFEDYCSGLWVSEEIFNREEG
ncbi:MAG TPA: GIY-YIG nuclease family protein [Candidatus Bathyarchaeia archaeon]|nr:GIY-YIG nuclease family protein [Desulfobacterales bacterium]HUU53055.1 GIY-YIG nuclease family protein [Candidatus Bathyarchaeia archaeon]